MIKHVHIRNFKSLEDVSVSLEPLTVLIGRSGSGKSNFVSALRWLRDYLTCRDADHIQQQNGSWSRILPVTAARPVRLAFAVTFTAPGLTEDFRYELGFEQRPHPSLDVPPELVEEKLSLGERCLFHHQQQEWLVPPALLSPPPPGGLMLGALTGLQEATIAHLVLTNGIGCYAFPDQVLTTSTPPPPRQPGLADNGANFLQAFNDIAVNLSTWHHLRQMAASLRRLKPTLRSLDLQQPGRNQVVVSLAAEDGVIVFDLSQESEGFRRLLACLLALYQTPPKQTLIFDEPEKGIYPAGLSVLADEFKAYTTRDNGQVLLTTHSPDFLDHFSPEQIRVVEMRGYSTHIGPVAPEQFEAIKEHFLTPGELLTVDEARVASSLAEVG